MATGKTAERLLRRQQWLGFTTLRPWQQEVAQALWADLAASDNHVINVVCSKERSLGKTALCQYLDVNHENEVVRVPMTISTGNHLLEYVSKRVGIKQEKEGEPWRGLVLVDVAMCAPFTDMQSIAPALLRLKAGEVEGCPAPPGILVACRFPVEDMKTLFGEDHLRVWAEHGDVFTCVHDPTGQVLPPDPSAPNAIAAEPANDASPNPTATTEPPAKRVKVTKGVHFNVAY